MGESIGSEREGGGELEMKISNVGEEEGERGNLGKRWLYREGSPLLKRYGLCFPGIIN